MTAARPKLRVLLDEGVPADVGQVFEAHGHDVIPFDQAVKRGSPDPVVGKAALANSAILVGFDKDLTSFARRYGISDARFKRLHLIKFECSEPMAAKRLKFAMSLIEHEWIVSTEKTARKLWIAISTHVLRTYR